jgi:hypothetical protein
MTIGSLDDPLVLWLESFDHNDEDGDDNNDEGNLERTFHRTLDSQMQIDSSRGSELPQIHLSLLECDAVSWSPETVRHDWPRKPPLVLLHANTHGIGRRLDGVPGRPVGTVEEIGGLDRRRGPETWDANTQISRSIFQDEDDDGLFYYHPALELALLPPLLDSDYDDLGPEEVDILDDDSDDSDDSDDFSYP